MSPAHIPDIVIYLDAITIVAEEEASKEGRPLYLPIASIDAGNDHNLPSLALRFLLVVLFYCLVLLLLVYIIIDVHHFVDNVISWLLSFTITCMFHVRGGSREEELVVVVMSARGRRMWQQ